MKSRTLNFLLIITSLFGFLEWSGNNQMFLFQAESEIIIKLFSDPIAVLHPFILLPLFGQILLLITLFQKTPSKILTLIGIGALGILLGFMFIIGLISFNFKIMLSTIPFLIVVFLKIKQYRKDKKEQNSNI